MKFFTLYITKKSKITECMLLLFILSILAYFFLFSKSNFKIMNSTLQVFIKIVIPSLCPFILFSNILIYTGGFDLIVNSKITMILKRFFNISKYGAACIIFGLLFGYPNGARYINELYDKKKLDFKEAEYLLIFINNSSPIYILSSIGIGLFSNIKIGILFLLSHTLASLLLGKIYRYKYNFYHYIKINHQSDNEYKYNINFDCVTKSIAKTFYTLGLIFGFMIIFVLLNNYITQGILHFYNISKTLEALILSILELTSGLNVLASLEISFTSMLLLTSFFLGFSSLSIIFQIFSCVYLNKFKFRNILKGKLLHGILSMIITYIILNIPQLYNYINISKSVSLNLYSNGKDNILNKILLVYFCTLAFYFLIFFLSYIKKKRHRLIVS